VTGNTFDGLLKVHKKVPFLLSNPLKKERLLPKSNMPNEFVFSKH
jgi:hypothetical protein